ncbi:hypothetical protein ASG54_12100 [Aureimonas sp. Leaf460]|nr:hypothetical protein ASG62_08235 [Aureimonas sp. Leaf427]KQT77003.1 hypothetical protein ASG54_12100 [Aureimonas sp. Leaf460]
MFVVLGLIALAGLVLVGNDLWNDGGRIAGLSSDEAGQIFYLGIWGSVIAAGALFAFRRDARGMARNAAIWALAFVVLIGLYAFRGEFGEVRDRIIAELIPGHAIALSGSDGRQVAVVRAGDDHFHVQAEVNGRSLSFLVDTGASMIALDRATARSMNLDPGDGAFTARVSTANGIARAAMIRLDEVRIGEIVRRNVPAAVMEQEGEGLGLLGMSFLGQLSSFEFRGNRLILTD